MTTVRAAAWLPPTPTHWRSVPLWTLFRRVKDVDHPGEEMLSVFREFGVVKKASRDNLNVTAENRSIYQLVHPGWLVTNRMKAWQGSVGISGLRGIVSGHYICFEPRHRECNSYLNWLFRSDPYRDGYGLMSRGVRIGQAEIDNDDYRQMLVLLPPVAEQRAIADYLDVEGARIDELIAKQQQLITALRERRSAAIHDAIRRAGGRPSKLKMHAHVQSGITLSGEGHADDHEWPYLRVANVQTGYIDTSTVKMIRASAQEAAASMLRPGDVLMTEGGDIDKLGRGSVWDARIHPCLHQNHVFAVRPRAELMARFLVYVLDGSGESPGVV